MSLPVERVRVRAPARLHFGVLDLRGMLGRRFGGMGAAVPAPALQLEAERADDLTATGPDAERAVAFARRYIEAAGLPGGARILITQSMPTHSGLGSGTQLALSVARALAELYGRPHDAATLARQVGRGARSGVGPGSSNGADSCWKVADGKELAWRRCSPDCPCPSHGAASWLCRPPAPG